MAEPDRPNHADADAHADAHAHAHTDAHAHAHDTADAADMFEPHAWDKTYSGDETRWSGAPNAQLVAEASALAPGTALDVGCGEGGDVVWLARNGWRATGADFSANGLARAARHAEAAGSRTASTGGRWMRAGSPPTAGRSTW
ncbi:hypothetical protein GCM10025870_11040 [Agromyces marinus]|uniref:Methyltransferase domain-containing protein n=1 Tax=Agromyces marinus TaxID=1389020 RepID=A0ABN6YDA8_9MICO|nr:methyltransferase domain-containing protein [Agromyces marinus]BDZ54031.1 hypothetical protein GCM10025870_11040 [Agromyces marinus]